MFRLWRNGASSRLPLIPLSAVKAAASRDTFLWHAFHESWLKSIPWLLDKSLDIGERDKDRISCFEAGCLRHESYTFEPVLSRGFDVNTRDRNGDTALHKCARDPKEANRYSNVIYHLIINGSDPNLKNQDGVSLRMMAKENSELAFTLEYAEGNEGA